MHVKWLATAKENLDSDADFIAKDNPKAAESIVQLVVKKIRVLEQYPFLGRIGRIPGTRELIISGTPYIVPYRIVEDRIEILRVIHASREWPKKF